MIILTIIIGLSGYFGYLAYQWHVSNIIARTPELSDKKAELLAKQAVCLKKLKYNQ